MHKHALNYERLKPQSHEVQLIERVKQHYSGWGLQSEQSTKRERKKKKVRVQLQTPVFFPSPLSSFPPYPFNLPSISYCHFPSSSSLWSVWVQSGLCLCVCSPSEVVFLLQAPSYVLPDPHSQSWSGPKIPHCWLGPVRVRVCGAAFARLHFFILWEKNAFI